MHMQASGIGDSVFGSLQSGDKAGAIKLLGDRQRALAQIQADGRLFADWYLFGEVFKSIGAPYVPRRDRTVL